MPKPKLVVVSGAGLSASAGIPTYRDKASGLWSIHKMQSICVKGNEFSDESIDFYNQFCAMETNTRPTAVHDMFAQLQAQFGTDRVKLHTQNIDTLLERAGCAAVHHVHGTISEHKCANCGFVGTEPTCGCLCPKMRKNVVFYGEKGYYAEMINDLFDLEPHDVFMLIGTSCEAINADIYVRSLKCRKIYVNLVVESEVDIAKYEKVVLGKAEDNLDEISAFVTKALNA